jgi:G:T-mismatch repair DNA endonuclease (very short patch repair protein)
MAGKPKPWLRGADNPNYQNKAQGIPEVRERMLVGIRQRGQAWTEKHRSEHRLRMLGPSNAMRGRHHSEETKRIISESKRRQYAQGVVRVRKYKISKAEREIHTTLQCLGVRVLTQFHIPQVPYLYDFYLPDCKLLIEFQGDYWHANPSKYPPGTTLRILGRNGGDVPVERIWARDAEKKRAALESGYKIQYIWESDYRARGLEILKELLNEHETT